MLVSKALVYPAGFFKQASSFTGRRQTGLWQMLHGNVKSWRTLALTFVLVTIFRATNNRLFVVSLTQAAIEKELRFYWSRARHQAQNRFVQINPWLRILQKRIQLIIVQCSLRCRMYSQECWSSDIATSSSHSGTWSRWTIQQERSCSNQSHSCRFQAPTRTFWSPWSNRLPEVAQTVKNV